MKRVSLLLLCACQDYDLKGTDDKEVAVEDSEPVDSAETATGDACAPLAADAEAVPLNDTCDYGIGGFTPIVEWDIPGKWSNALPVVADLDGDGLPEIVVIWAKNLFSGRLAVYHGDGSGLYWENTELDVGYGSAPAVADLDGDGPPEVVTVRQYGSYLFGIGDYTLIAWTHDGTILWETEHFTDDEFDAASGPVISDMDHDGSPEIVVGNLIFHADGTLRAQSRYEARGCPADAGLIKEGAWPAVADLDLDGVEEVITGNTIFDLTGAALWHDGAQPDGAVAVANLDDDPEGEFVVTSWNSVRAHDTDGRILWGPLTNPKANIMPVPAIGDIDSDGYPEIIVAGGNELWALRHDGTIFWTYPVTDISGATGASLFDFDADGIAEVVYIDEVQMVAFDGVDGTVKFQTDEHASATMYDYPVIADVDADGHAEIVVVHGGYSTGLSVYGDATDSWAPVRQLWNQHAYTITNINDDLSVPTTAVPNFTTYNNYHSALATEPGERVDAELEAAILDVCTDDCAAGSVRVLIRANNTGNTDIAAGLALTLYARVDGADVRLTTVAVPDAIPSGWSSAAIEVVVNADLVAGAQGLTVIADDDGTGTGHVAECLEDNNAFYREGALCD